MHIHQSTQQAKRYSEQVYQKYPVDHLTLLVVLGWHSGELEGNCAQMCEYLAKMYIAEAMVSEIFWWKYLEFVKKNSQDTENIRILGTFWSPIEYRPSQR